MWTRRVVGFVVLFGPKLSIQLSASPSVGNYCARDLENAIFGTLTTDQTISSAWALSLPVTKGWVPSLMIPP